jgi:formylglycine-generating enzyme required for sulfatase activity
MKRRVHVSIIVAVLFSLSAFHVSVGAEDKSFISPTISAYFILIPAGKFVTGDIIQHEIILSKPFYMQTTEVTQGQWRKVMGNNPSMFKDCGDNCPVENISWGDIQEFIRRLNQTERVSKYRLPTEAEWEFACRAGSITKYSFGDSESELEDYAWYDKNSGRRTHSVSQKKPNAWGLYDMHGNVSEWCQDWQDDYPSGTVSDPKGPAAGQHRVMRGGSWLDSAVVLRSAFRAQDYPMVRGSDIGFRLVRDL